MQLPCAAIGPGDDRADGDAGGAGAACAVRLGLTTKMGGGDDEPG
jgi:hypothetical protein